MIFLQYKSKNSTLILNTFFWPKEKYLGSLMQHLSPSLIQHFPTCLVLSDTSFFALVLILTAAAAVTSVVSDSMRPHRRQPACQWVKVSQLCPTLCDPMDCMVHGILQARILGNLSLLQGICSIIKLLQFLSTPCYALPLYLGLYFLPSKKWRSSEVTQSCLILCDPMDCSLTGSSIHGIFQAIVLEWIAISFSNLNTH